MLSEHLKTDIHEISAESKARLAKLLATEDISIEHRVTASTAAFDLLNRTLILPNWTNITNDTYDLLVLHEVGHARFTPLEGWHNAVSEKGKGPNFKGFLNVIEDARIEKKIKRKFPGGRKAFTQGYKDLLDRNFFGLDGRDVNSFGLIDRINMYFKGGVAMGVKFTDAEQVFVDRTAAAETWADVESIANDLWDIMKDQMAETDREPDHVTRGPSSDDTNESDEEGEMGEGFEPSDDAGSSSNADADASDKDDTGSDPTSGNGKADETGVGRNTDGSDGRTQGDPWSETDSAQRKNEEKLVDTNSSREDPLYGQIPKDAAFDLDTIIIPHAKIFAAQLLSLGKQRDESLNDAKKALAAFRRDNIKVVNYLVKEFEMRKAADSHRRSTTSRSGTLDMAKIHSYKWNDDLFKKITDVADGKNHGLVMFVDWSGSMSSNMEGTLEQILNLVLFCKKVNIPFDVYGFTDSADKGMWSDEKNGRVFTDRMHEELLETGDATYRREYFNLLHLAGSKGTKSDFQNMLLGLIMLRGGFGHGYGRNANRFPIPRWMGLGGTPLSEAVITAIPVVNKFRADHRVQIVNTVFLTDGCGGNLNNYHGDTQSNRYGNPSRVILRDRKSHKEFVVDHGNGQFPALLEIVRLRTGSKIVNMYLTSPKGSGFKYAYKQSRVNESDWQTVETESIDAWKEAKKEGGFTLENSSEGWDQHYLILGNEDVVDERLSDDLVGAKKGAISKAFRTTSAGKLRNRVVLRKFTELIAR